VRFEVLAAVRRMMMFFSPEDGDNMSVRNAGSADEYGLNS
jgi:hypothetical protein